MERISWGFCGRGWGGVGRLAGVENDEVEVGFEGGGGCVGMSVGSGGSWGDGMALIARGCFGAGKQSSFSLAERSLRFRMRWVASDREQSCRV